MSAPTMNFKKNWLYEFPVSLNLFFFLLISKISTVSLRFLLIVSFISDIISSSSPIYKFIIKVSHLAYNYLASVYGISKNSLSTSSLTLLTLYRIGNNIIEDTVNMNIDPHNNPIK